MQKRRVFAGFVPCRGCGRLEPALLAPPKPPPIIVCRDCLAATLAWLCRQATALAERPQQRLCADCGRICYCKPCPVGRKVLFLCPRCEPEWAADLSWEE